ncbi:MAG TPA: thioesterase family protein [Paenirhodobacter sp.]
MSDETPAPDLRARSSYAFFSEESLRISDLDMNAHVNNIAFIQLLENARNQFITQCTPLKRGTAMTFMLVRFEIDFVSQLFWPGKVDGACRVAELRRSSLSFGQALFDGDRCAATARATIVNVDRGTGRSAPFTDEARAVLAALAAG